MGSYYTLYTIFYNSFYVPNIIKIPVLIGFYSLWPKLKKTGLDRFQPVAVPVFWYFRIRQPVAHFWVKKLDQTRPVNTRSQWRTSHFLNHGRFMKHVEGRGPEHIHVPLSFRVSLHYIWKTVCVEQVIKRIWKYMGELRALLTFNIIFFYSVWAFFYSVWAEGHADVKCRHCWQWWKNWEPMYTTFFWWLK